MIDLDPLADARARLISDADRAIWDRALQNAQTLSPVRRGLVEAALALVSLQPTDLAYQQALYPFDPPAQARQLATHQSGCGLTYEAEMRAIGVDEPLLYGPVGPRSIHGGREYPIALERDDESRWGGLTDCAVWTTQNQPEPGDACVIGCSACRGVWSRNSYASEHEFLVVLVDGDVVHSVDGGQPSIALRTRRLVTVAGSRELWAADMAATLTAADMRPSKGRRFLSILRADGLRLRPSATADTDPAPPMERCVDLE